MTQIIGLAGLAGSGKTTVAHILQRDHYFQALAFAEPLKSACRELWGFTEAQLYGDQKEVVDERWGITPRTAMQQMGAEYARTLCEDVHVMRLLERAEGLKRVAVHDVRFPNEIAALRAAGGRVWWVSRLSVRRSGRVHVSERSIGPEDCDLFVPNDGTIEQLERRVSEELAAWLTSQAETAPAPAQP